MSILIIGGDQISQISSMLTQMGAKTINPDYAIEKVHS